MANHGGRQVDYNFTTVEAMKAAIAAGEFIENAEVHKNLCVAVAYLVWQCGRPADHSGTHWGRGGLLAFCCAQVWHICRSSEER